MKPFQSFVLRLATTSGLLLSACASELVVTEKSGDFAIVAVNIVDVDTGEIRSDQSVLVEGDTISFIGPSTSVTFTEQTQIIDGHQKFLAPGLADMHVHVNDEFELPLHVSYGVTMLRNMWGEDHHLPFKERIASGDLISPLMQTAGPLLDGAPKIWPTSIEVGSVSEGREHVIAQVADGFDFIKVYSNMTEDVFVAIADQSKQEGVDFVGHVPEVISVQKAIGAGMTSMEHLYGLDRATVRKDFDLGAGRWHSPERLELGARVNAGELRLDEIFDYDKLSALADEVAQAGTWNVPTLLVARNIKLSRTQAMEKFTSAEMKYVSPFARDFWDPGNFANRYDTDENLAAIQAFNQLSLDQTLTLHKAGAKILAGSDSGNRFVFHGYSLHEELALLVEAGLTPLEAIRTATTNAAEYFDESDTWGVVETGYRADLVLLSENPLLEIDNYLSIEGVMLRGRWFDPEGIEELRAFSADAYVEMDKNRHDGEPQGGYLPHICGLPPAVLAQQSAKTF